jgi:hypothetical protein
MLNVDDQVPVSDWARIGAATASRSASCFIHPIYYRNWGLNYFLDKFYR